MGNNQFLIPSNTKQGQLLFGFFYPIDLAILITGVFITFVLLMISAQVENSTLMSILAVIPGLIAGALVFPVPNYHNIRVALGEVISFYTNNRQYRWRGWCIEYESRIKQIKSK